MPAKDLGVKHTCFKCGAKFYDLKKPEPTCPKCGADQREGPAQKRPPPAEKRSRPLDRAAVEPSDDLELDAKAELVEEEGEEPADDVLAAEDE